MIKNVFIFIGKYFSKKIALSWMIAVFASSSLMLYEAKIASSNPDGVHFQSYTSDILWQTLDSSALKNNPIEALYYLHKEPPLFDIIRASMIHIFKLSLDDNLCNNLDKIIYILWSLCFGAMSALVFIFLLDWTKNTIYSLILTLIWVFNPATIYFATYTDSCILVSLLVLWLFHEVWKLSENRGSGILLGLSSALLFLLRATFMLNFFVLFTICLFLMKLPKKEFLKFFLVIILLVVPYSIKQYAVFGNVGSTFIGYHIYYLVAGPKSIDSIEFQRLGREIVRTYPEKASMSQGIYNTEKSWRENFIYHKLAFKYLKAHPVNSLKNILKTIFIYSWPKYWQPSATFLPNTAVVNLPWFKFSNKALAYPWFFLYLTLAFIVYFLRSFLGKKKKQVVSMIGPFLLLFYIFMSSNTVNANGYGHTEATKYKFFLEPVYFIFIATQFYFLLLCCKRQKIADENGAQ